MDALKDNRKLKPKTVTFLDSDGQQLSVIVAEQIADKVDELLRSE